MTVATAQIFKVQQAQFIACAYVFEGPSGNWIVQDEMDSRGGLFANRKAALKFARHEFGSETEIVMDAPSTASEEMITVKPWLHGLEGLFSRDAWNQRARDIADAARMKGCWDAAAQHLIQQSALPA